MYDFDYHKPAKLADAAALAARDNHKPLAGGMSLLPALKLRLNRCAGLVDLGALADLRGIRRDGDTLVIGATTPHAMVAASDDVRAALPALTVLAAGIGDPLVRNRGTLGGSLANADPGADYPSAVLGLGAMVATNRREIPGDAFFTGLFETALQPGEIITAVRFPLPQRAGYAKYRQPASRFAITGVFVARTASGVRVAVTGAAPFVFRFSAAEAALSKRFEAAALDGVTIPAEGLNSDIHASAEYRAHCVIEMTRRAVAAAQ
jgi:carbon-monoxide dehydrogenase medium subunit